MDECRERDRLMFAFSNLNNLNDLNNFQEFNEALENFRKHGKPLEKLSTGENMTQKEKANDVQVAGDHYKSQPIQPWDYIAVNGLGYFEGNVVKYVSRWRDKGGVDDLRKARHYLDKLIELQELGNE
jgi:hypothetical protein